METIRTFIAIDLPVEVQQALGQLTEVLSLQIPRGSVRWVKPEQMHLTLVFLGDTTLSKLPAIQTALDDVTARHPAFTLQLGRVGCFPNCKRPRVIWVGLEEGDWETKRLERGRLEIGDSALARLKANLDEALRPLGWEPEQRPFRAHLTLGRVKDSQKVRNVSWAADVPALSFPVASVHLIQSDLRPSGPIYTVRHSSHLTR